MRSLARSGIANFAIVVILERQRCITAASELVVLPAVLFSLATGCAFDVVHAANLSLAFQSQALGRTGPIERRHANGQYLDIFEAADGVKLTG